MRWLQLKLVNWRTYSNATFNFTGDMIGIVGSNGSGKSNLLAAIEYLTLGTSARTKASNLRRGAESGYVEGRFSHHGDEYTIRRDITSAKCRLTDHSTGKSVAKGDEVNSRMHALVGVDPRIFSSHVVVSQFNMDAAVRAKPAELSSMFQHLFGTTKCESLREQLMVHINRFAAYVPVDTDLDAMRTKVAELEAQTRRQEHELTGIEVQLSEINTAALQAVMNDYAAWHRHLPLKLQLEATLARLTQSAKDAAVELDARRSQLKQVQAAAEQLRESAVKYTRIAACHAELQHLDSTAADARRQLDETTRRLAELTSTTPSPPVNDLKPLQDARDELAVKTGTLQDRVIKLKSTTAAVCPVCGGELRDRQARLAESEAELLTLNSQFMLAQQRLNDRVAAYTAETQAVTRHAEALRQLQAQAEQARQAVSTLDTRRAQLQTEIAGVSVETATQWLAAYQELSATVGVKESEYKAATAAVAQIEAHITETSTALAKLVLPAREVSDVEYNMAYAKLKQHEELSAQRIRCLTMRTESASQLGAARTELETAQKRYDVTLNAVKYRQLLERARNVLHRDNLPKVIAQRHLVRLNRTLELVLRRLQFPFACKITENGAFEFTDTEGYVFPAEELSGGQRMKFCVGYLLAVNDQYASDFNLLALDEPTAYVDDDNIALIAEALEHIRSYAKSSGVQLLVITHEQSLRSVFDQVIEIKPDAN